MQRHLSWFQRCWCLLVATIAQLRCCPAEQHHQKLAHTRVMQDGKFQFSRLESLLREAAKSPSRRKPSATDTPAQKGMQETPSGEILAVEVRCAERLESSVNLQACE